MKSTTKKNHKTKKPEPTYTAMLLIGPRLCYADQEQHYLGVFKTKLEALDALIEEANKFLPNGGQCIRRDNRNIGPHNELVGTLNWWTQTAEFYIKKNADGRTKDNEDYDVAEEDNNYI